MWGMGYSSATNAGVFLFWIDMKTPHTATYRGKRVRVKLRSGLVFIDKFHSRTKSYVIFENRGRVHKGDIASFSNYNPGLEIC